MDALAALCTEDCVMLAPGRAPVRGREEVRRLNAEARRAGNGTEVLDYRERFEETILLGDFAVEWGVIEGSERTPGGEPLRQRFHVMRILRRQSDGSWLVHRSIFNAEPAD